MLKSAIALEVGNEGIVGDNGFAAALGDDCEIVQIFEELLVVGDGKNDGGALAMLVSEILQGLAHTAKATHCPLRCRDRIEKLTLRLLDETDGHGTRRASAERITSSQATPATRPSSMARIRSVISAGCRGGRKSSPGL